MILATNNTIIKSNEIFFEKNFIFDILLNSQKDKLTDGFFYL